MWNVNDYNVLNLDETFFPFFFGWHRFRSLTCNFIERWSVCSVHVHIVKKANTFHQNYQQQSWTHGCMLKCQNVEGMKNGQATEFRIWMCEKKQAKNQNHWKLCSFSLRFLHCVAFISGCHGDDNSECICQHVKFKSHSYRNVSNIIFFPVVCSIFIPFLNIFTIFRWVLDDLTSICEWDWACKPFNILAFGK